MNNNDTSTREGISFNQLCRIAGALEDGLVILEQLGIEVFTNGAPDEEVIPPSHPLHAAFHLSRTLTYQLEDALRTVAEVAPELVSDLPGSKKPD